MKISTYKHADCRLYRLPPLDISEISEALEEAMIRAWETGGTADKTLNSILNNDTIIDKLAIQMETSLNFQKEAEMQQTQIKYKTAVKEFEIEKENKLKQVQETYSNEKSTIQEEIKKTEEAHKENKQAYSASQARLEEIRARIQSNLEKVGGKQGFKQLMTINDILEHEEPTESPQTMSSGQEGYKSIAVPQPAQETATYGPPEIIEKPELEKPKETTKMPKETTKMPKVELEKIIEKVSDTEEPKKKGKTRRFFRKMWEVMNYKIW